MPADRWRARRRTAGAALLLCGASLTVAVLPFRLWRNWIGGDGSIASAEGISHARRLAADIEWAAKRLPMESKCLARAMALSWMLRRRRIGHAVVVAVRPAGQRGSGDDLHAWVEAGRETVIGGLPGPWIETLRLGG